MFGTCFEVFLPVKNFAQCTLEGRNLVKLQKTVKNFNFSKCPKNVPKSNQTCLEHASRYFCRWKISPSAPWRVEKSKNFKKLENFQFSKCPNTFPKVFKLVFNMLRGIFSGKKIRPVHPGGSRNRKISKNGKKFNFSKSRKTFPKVSKFLLRWFFPNFSWPVQPGDQNL